MEAYIGQLTHDRLHVTRDDGRRRRFDEGRSVLAQRLLVRE
jgi:hypothetical protein